MFPYMGGKSQHRRFLDQILPQAPDTWIDVFGGAGWVTVRSEAAFTARHRIYNDANPMLSNAWHWISTAPLDLAETLEQLPWQDADLYREFQHRLFVLGEPCRDIQAAARYLYLQVQSFSGNTLSATSSVYFHPQHTLRPLVRRLRDPEWQQRFQGVEVRCQDAVELIQQCDAPGVFFYLDPPYHQRERYYTQSWPQSRHHELAQVLQQCQARWALSYYDFAELQQWYDPDRFPRHRYRLYRPSSGKRTRDRTAEELVITNYT